MKSIKIQLFANAMLLLSPFISFGQGGLGGPGDGGADGNGGSAVPFDCNMNL